MLPSDALISLKQTEAKYYDACEALCTIQYWPMSSECDCDPTARLGGCKVWAEFGCFFCLSQPLHIAWSLIATHAILHKTIHVGTTWWKDNFGGSTIALQMTPFQS